MITRGLYMDKNKAIKDLKTIAKQINDYADQMISDYDNIRDFSIWIRLNVDGSEVSTYEVQAEYKV